MVGNDVLDLCFLDSPAAQHIRHLARVCTLEEELVVRKSNDPSKSLAIVWAAKESAYKLLARQLAQCQFIPRQFLTYFPNGVPTNPGGEIVVTYAGMEVRVAISLTDRWVHAVASYHGDEMVCWAVREIDSYPLCGGQARHESEAVRILAAELLAERCGRELVLEFVGRIPTLRPKDGGLADIDISLSHHGRFVAVAIAARAGQHFLPWQLDSRSVEVSSLEEMCFTCTA